MSMELDNSFTVPAAPERAWDVLLDVERVAPCMPGATVEEFDGEVVTGRIKVKVGPVSLTHRGTAKFIERDAGARVVVLDASGKETRGAGTAAAAVRASLEPEAAGAGTLVVIHTTMNVTGRPAQFGRGVIAEVGGKLIEKFADNLAQLISDSNGGIAPAGVAESTPAGASAAAADGTQDAGAGSGVAAGAANGAATPGEAMTPAADTPASSAADTPAVSAPATPASSVVAAPPAPKGEDSLNLVRLVGPAILKRVVPVAAGVAALALLAMRFRHLLRRGARKR